MWSRVASRLNNSTLNMSFDQCIHACETCQGIHNFVSSDCSFQYCYSCCRGSSCDRGIIMWSWYHHVTVALSCDHVWPHVSTIPHWIWLLLNVCMHVKNVGDLRCIIFPLSLMSRQLCFNWMFQYWNKTPGVFPAPLTKPLLSIYFIYEFITLCYGLSKRKGIFIMGYCRYIVFKPRGELCHYHHMIGCSHTDHMSMSNFVKATAFGGTAVLKILSHHLIIFWALRLCRKYSRIMFCFSMCDKIKVAVIFVIRWKNLNVSTVPKISYTHQRHSCPIDRATALL